MNFKSTLFLMIGLVIAGAVVPASDALSAPRKKQAPTKLGPKGVVAKFSAAQKLYNAGQYAEALTAYDRLLKQYPAHEPTMVQYAKTLYKLDRIPESYNLFARINPQYLDPETSYEYGYASYVNQRYDAALFGFKRVPLDHALFDLANYYGALSAIKLRRYSEAQDMLDKAVVLPDKLAQSRKLYQKHIQALKNLKEKADLEEAKTSEKTRLNQIKNSPATDSTKSPHQVAATGQLAPGHAGFFKLDRFAEIRVSRDHQTIDKHGFSQTFYDSEIGSFSFKHAAKADIPFNRFSDRSSAIAIQLNLGLDDRTIQGRRERLVVYEDSRDVPRVIDDPIEPVHATVGKIGGDAWVELALPQNWWTGLKLGLNFEYPDFERGQRTSKRFVKTHLGKKLKLGKHTGDVIGVFTYEQLTDSETKPLIDTSRPEFQAGVFFSTSTELRLNIDMNSYNYHLATISGPDEIYSAGVLLRQSFPLGVSLSANGAMASMRNNIVRGLPTYDVASADGETMSGGASLEVALFSWFAVGADYKVAKTTWSVIEEERVDVFERNIANYVDQTTYWGSLLFQF
jgi:tetratricopeptide (TPR) repeat protein